MNKEYDIYSYPRNFFVNITGRCNLKCVYCSSANFNTSFDMPQKKLEYIINQLKEHGVLKIVITGGEPLIHPDFDWVIDEFTKFSTVSVNTNGIFLADHMDFFEKFEFKKRLSFNISLDSLYREKNSKTRGNYNINLVLKALVHLHEIGYSTSILSTVTCFLDEADIKAFQQFQIETPGIGWALNDLKLTGRAADPMKKLLPTLKTIKMINSTAFHSFQNFDFEERENNNVDLAGLISCGAGKQCLSINESGDVFPCTAMYIKIGNIFEKSIKDMCDNSDIIKEINDMRNKKIDTIAECQSCEFLKKCKGGCRANAYIATRSLYGVDPYCWHNGKYFREVL